ncbi:uncharacterized protein [Chironomus tepperi]|uniref:uncharacterized protein n=1 Tax=Chironomus tepperi TaxID=113505 RepID=UPI00391F9C6B
MKLYIYFHVLSALTVIIFSARIKNSSPNVSDILQKIQNASNVKDLMTNLQKNIKRAASMGIVMGTIKTARKMETNILTIIHEFIKTLQGSNMRQAVEKYQKIEDTIERDKKALEILTSAMNVAMGTETINDYRQALHKMSNNLSKSAKSQIIPKDKKELMKQAQNNVNSHLQFLRKTMNATVHETITHMQQPKKKSEISSTPSTITSSLDSHAKDIFKHETYNLPLLYIRMPIWPVHQSNLESFYRFRRQNDDDATANAIDGDSPNENEKVDGDNDEDEEFGDGLDSPLGGGGLAGLIAGLSGGEEGSDVGALVGALSGVVTNLFGPNGLDVPSLISTGTSLLAGLLGGDENFGKVLATYLGIAVEGLSGGGGADNNGAFFGNFVGTLFAQLSADPEEDDAPPKPKIFFENFLKGFDQTKQKRGTNEPSSHRNYIFEFLSNIISSVVGGITNLILNSSLGSSGGSSQGAADLSAGSSQGSHAGSAYASQQSSMSSMKSPMHGKPKSHVSRN